MKICNGDALGGPTVLVTFKAPPLMATELTMVGNYMIVMVGVYTSSRL